MNDVVLRQYRSNSIIITHSQFIKQKKDQLSSGTLITHKILIFDEFASHILSTNLQGKEHNKTRKKNPTEGQSSQ
jgi:hypothetical protein